MLFPGDPVLQEVCRVSVQRNLLADLRGKTRGFTLKEWLDSFASEERKFIRLAKRYVFLENFMRTHCKCATESCLFCAETFVDFLMY